MGGEHDYLCTFFSTEHVYLILYICTQQMYPAPLNDRRSSLYFLKLSETLPMQQERMNVGAWKCARVESFIQADAHRNATRNTGRNIQQYLFV